MQDRGYELINDRSIQEKMKYYEEKWQSGEKDNYKDIVCEIRTSRISSSDRCDCGYCSLMSTYVTRTGEQVFVWYQDPESSSEDTKYMMNYMRDVVKTNHGVLIIPGKIDLGTSKSIKKSTLDIEVFNYKELQFNPTKGVYSPEFTKMSKKEIEEQRVDPNLQRRMKEDDIISRHYYFRAGDLIRIRNHNPLSMMVDIEVMYALVIK